MKVRFLLQHEWQQFKTYQKLRLPLLLLLLFIYGFFIYRYMGIVQEKIPGNIVSFLKVQSGLTDYLVINMTSFLFYTLPFIYLGTGWLRAMSTSNIMIKVRQPFSWWHLIYGECLLAGVSVLWFIINQMMYHGLNLPFASPTQYFSTFCLFMLIGNLLLACHLKGGNLIGWIIILIGYPIFIMCRPSVITVVILLLIVLLFNIYALKTKEIEVGD